MEIRELTDKLENEILAEKFIEEHDNDKRWSQFNGLEILAIKMFAKWVDSKKVEKSRD